MHAASRIPGCTILSDEFNHALMIEGIRHSRSETRIFAHNDPRDLERKLSDLDQHAPSRNFVTSRMLTTPALPQSGFVRWRKRTSTAPSDYCPYHHHQNPYGSARGALGTSVGAIEANSDLEE
jgi:hypothetical protein